MIKMDELISEIIELYGMPERFERGQTFVHQGMAMPSMYYQTHGKVKIEQRVVSGKSVLFGFTGAGNWLGDLELFSETEVAHSTATAVTTVKTIRFPIHSLRRHLQQQPALSAIFARSLAAKMWANSKASAVNLLYPLRERYAAYLYEMSTDASELPIALETSAGLLGAGERQLQRVLREFAENGIVDRSGRTLTIVNRNALRRIASEIVSK